MTIAPDGSSVAYIDGGRLMRRAMDRLEAVPLTQDRQGLRGPFFSPNGQWLGFVTTMGGAIGLAKVSTTGGPTVRLCSLDGTPRGATTGGPTAASSSPPPIRRRACGVSRRLGAHHGADQARPRARGSSITSGLKSA
jgi:hypothetical protein